MPSATKISIPVTGMTCAACQARVQRALATAPGVDEATVNLLLHNASVTYDPTATTLERLVDTIRATGYGAVVPRQPNDSSWSAAFAEELEQERDHAKEARRLAWKAGISLAVGLSAMLLPMSAVGAYALLVFTSVIILW